MAYQGVSNVSKTSSDKFRVQFVRPGIIDFSKSYDNPQDAINKAKELQKKYPTQLKLGTESPEYKLREYLKKLKPGSAFNRTELQRRFFGTGPDNVNDLGRLGKVLKEFSNKNFKITSDPPKRPIRKVLSNKEAKFLNQRFSSEYGNLKGQELYNKMVKQGEGPRVSSFLSEVRAGTYTGEGRGSPERNKIIRQLNKIKNNNALKKFFKEGKFKTNDIEEISTKIGKVLDTSPSIAARRIQDMARAFAGDKNYIDVKTDNPELLKGARRVSSIGKSSVFQDLGSTFKRDRYETEVTKQLGFDKNYFKNVRQKYTRLFRQVLPEKYSTDEIRNIATGAKSGAGGYSVFAQGIPSRINTGIKTIVDNAAGFAEKELQKLDPKSPRYNVDREAIKDSYNIAVKNFVKQANIKNKKGALPVRAFEMVLDTPPSETVKRYDELPKNITSNLDKTYEKFGYSYKVPKDVRTMPELDNLFKDPDFRKSIVKFSKLGPRAFTIPLAGYFGYQVLKPGEAAAAEIEPKDNIEFNKEIGAFVDPKTDDKVSQSTLLNWAADNPMPTAAVASTSLLSKTVRKGTGKLLKGLLSTLGSSAAGLGFAGMTVKGNLEDGKNIVDATVDPMVGIELLYPEAAKRFGGKGLQNALGRALALGRIGTMMTPVGIGITALGVGKELYNIAQEEQDRINEMRENDPVAYQEYLAEQQELMDVSA
jgi:hypothetical protein